MRPCTKITSVQIFARNRKRNKKQNATFEGMTPNVPEFFRIGIRFERIPGRSASSLQKWHFFVLPLLGELSKSSRDSWESDSDSNESRDDRLHSFKSGVFIFLRFLVNFSNKNVSSIPLARIFIPATLLQGRVIRAPDNNFCFSWYRANHYTGTWPKVGTPC